MRPALLYQVTRQCHHTPLRSVSDSSPLPFPAAGIHTAPQLNTKPAPTPYVIPHIKFIPTAGGFLVLTTILCLP